jgi:hypothetical protein
MRHTTTACRVRDGRRDGWTGDVVVVAVVVVVVVDRERRGLGRSGGIERAGVDVG